MKFLRSLLALALALVACHSKKETEPESLPPLAVRTVVVENKERPSSEEVVGTVRAKLRAAIEAKVSARIEALLVAPGQMVKAGDLIAQLDPREIQARLDQALALRQQATRDLARGRELLDKKITTQADFDAVQARASVAEGAAREMETMLGYTKIVAPFDGIVTRKLADVGDLAAPGKPIIEMEDPHALRFEADVPEALIGHVKLGAKLPVQVAQDSGPIEGTVVEVAPVADPASRTFLVKLDLPTAEGLRSGQFGRVWVPTGENKSIRVPRSAVVIRGQMECVFVVVNQHAQLRLVRTGEHAGGEVEILAGLSPGERVVSEDAASLRDGQPVTLKQ
ncbi:MAG: efflux RND transporter periplasmic adaptor subunit [Chthoniobacterales bacterium]